MGWGEIGSGRKKIETNDDRKEEPKMKAGPQLAAGMQYSFDYNKKTKLHTKKCMHQRHLFLNFTLENSLSLKKKLITQRRLAHRQETEVKAVPKLVRIMRLEFFLQA